MTHREVSDLYCGRRSWRTQCTALTALTPAPVLQRDDRCTVLTPAPVLHPVDCCSAFHKIRVLVLIRKYYVF